MSNKIFILVLVWTLVGALWLWAAPPGNPPGGAGLISWDQTNSRLAISTTTIFIGTGTVLDMNSKRITRLADPTAATDAANKRYVDNNYGGSNAQKLWGEGRPGVGLVNSAGECTNTIPNPDVKISRSNVAVVWEGGAAACPRGWWVCNKSDRDKDTGSTAYGTCGSGNKDFFECDWNSSTNDEIKDPGDTNRAWLADWGSSDSGTHVTVAGTGGISEVCYMLPVWCCQN